MAAWTAAAIFEPVKAQIQILAAIVSSFFILPATDNAGDGIRANAECFIAGNQCGNNRGPAIHTLGQRNRIDGNNVVFNPGGGIKVDSTLSFIVRNSLSGNSGNN